jgi:RND family efflux transporter MFP subunit
MREPFCSAIRQHSDPELWNSYEFRHGLVAVLLIASQTALAQGPKGGGPPPATVVVAKVIEREEAAGQTFIGTLQPRRRSTVGSAVDGRVDQYPINDGQWVKKGEVLAELLKESMKIEIRNAKAELALRQAELDEHKNGSQEEDKAQARAKQASMKALWDYAKARHTRSENLFQRGTGITQEDMDASLSNLSAAEQNYVAAKAAYDLIKDWPRPEKMAQMQAKFDAQQEMVNQLEDRLAKYTIRAPFDGYVVAKHTDVGEWINRGDAIAEVISIDPIEVVVSVPESSIPNLQEALAAAEETGGPLTAAVRVDALGAELFTGSIERIVPQADLRSRTFPVMVLLQNPVVGKSHKFKSGMICHVSLPAGKPQKMLLVPKDAVVLGGQTPRVMVADKSEDPTTKKEVVIGKPVPVEIGAPSGSLIQVTGPLKPGMSVVIRGNERLIPGQPLNVVKEEK